MFNSMFVTDGRGTNVGIAFSDPKEQLDQSPVGPQLRLSKLLQWPARRRFGLATKRGLLADEAYALVSFVPQYFEW